MAGTESPEDAYTAAPFVPDGADLGALREAAYEGLVADLRVAAEALG
ncbi:hypothetical protein ACFWMG_07190 [Streptomyces sp. NPDC127074]